MSFLSFQKICYRWSWPTENTKLTVALSDGISESGERDRLFEEVYILGWGDKTSTSMPGFEDKNGDGESVGAKVKDGNASTEASRVYCGSSHIRSEHEGV